MNEKENRLMESWRRQLAREYRHLCWLYRLRLRLPLFEIREGQSRAGAWSPGLDTLSLASWLIRDHAWDVVLEVLKHEMSHQYVQQILGRGGELPHGPAFQEACDRLGVHPEFRAAQGAIPRLLRVAGGQSGGMLARVEKLFALAQSANEHEAALAMAKANAILRRCNLERLDRQTATDYDYLIIHPGTKRIAAHQRAMAALLKDFFYVNVVIAQQFEAQSGETLRVIELTGARENLAVAEHVYHFLSHRLAYLWREFRKSTGATGREKNSYWLGVLNGFREKLLLQDRQEQGARRATGGQSESSLICAADPGLIRYYRARYPRLRTVQHHGPRVYADTYQAGQQEGKQLIIHKGVGAEGGNTGLLLAEG
ncbi:MAG: SprT-like domain-containing protein [Desulfurivibrionaceae bacterium]